MTKFQLFKSYTMMGGKGKKECSAVSEDIEIPAHSIPISNVGTCLGIVGPYRYGWIENHFWMAYVAHSHSQPLPNMVSCSEPVECSSAGLS
jgi:hypothetical protein